MATSSNQFIAIALTLGPNKNTYTRSVFTIMNLFGNVGGIYGLLQSIWGILVGAVSTQIMLASVFRRLYFTNKNSFEDQLNKIVDRPRKVANMPIEEIKGKNIRSIFMSNRRDDSRSHSEIRVDLSDGTRSQRSTVVTNHK